MKRREFIVGAAAATGALALPLPKSEAKMITEVWVQQCFGECGWFYQPEGFKSLKAGDIIRMKYPPGSEAATPKNVAEMLKPKLVVTDGRRTTNRNQVSPEIGDTQVVEATEEKPNVTNVTKAGWSKPTTNPRFAGGYPDDRLGYSITTIDDFDLVKESSIPNHTRHENWATVRFCKKCGESLQSMPNAPDFICKCEIEVLT